MRYENAESWPQRPWLLAGLCALAGLLFQALVDVAGSGEVAAWRQALGVFVFVSAVAFTLTAERRRLTWAVAFALAWGAILALIGWFTARYNVASDLAEWPFLSGLLAVLVAAPLFQTLRDTGDRRLPYPRLHHHAWTDAVIGAASLFFTGISFLLAFLIAQLFEVIGIRLIEDLLDEAWFGWTLAGAAFGGAAGLLRERDALVGTLQRLVMVVFSVLAPVLAAALLLFLAALPLTGLRPLWDSSVPSTPMLLLAAAGAILLVNSVIGNSQEERSASRVLRLAGLALLLVVLPLAILAGISLGQRIGQYGWTPERIWGVVTILVALAYGTAGWAAVAKGRLAGFDDRLRPLQSRLALGLCGLALLLALPIIDFGAISARSQLARLESGRIPPAEFDWAAMAMDFGPAGRRALERMVAGSDRTRATYARQALAARHRYDLPDAGQVQAEAGLERRLRLLPPLTALTPELRTALVRSWQCTQQACAVLPIDRDRVMVISSDNLAGALLLTRDARSGQWLEAVPAPPGGKSADLATAVIEIRPVQRRQVFVDGRPVGPLIE